MSTAGMKPQMMPARSACQHPKLSSKFKLRQTQLTQNFAAIKVELQNSGLLGDEK
jgi:hypothetical protein